MLFKTNSNQYILPQFKGRSPKKQQGNVLMVTTLTLLISITVLVISNANSSIINSKLSGNIIDKKRSVLAADSASRYAWKDLQENYDLEKFVQNKQYSGFYDLREKAADTQKNNTQWEKNKDPSSWLGKTSSLHESMPNKLALSSDISFPVQDSNNPMRLFSAPQYALGMYEPIARKGTESLYCMPVSILGSAKGGLETTQTLIEINTIPKKGCFRNLVK